jgi:hypothetical protein
MFTGHHRQRAVEFLVVQREVRYVVRGLARTSRSARFAHIEGVERQAAFGEEVSECRLEEVVREAVYVKNHAADRLLLAGFAPHQHGRDRAFAIRIGAQFEYVLAVAFAEVVRLPSGIIHVGKCSRFRWGIFRWGIGGADGGRSSPATYWTRWSRTGTSGDATC